MSGQNPPPLPVSNTKLWWFAWILSTAVVPGVVCGLLATTSIVQDVILPLAGFGVLILHIIASVKLGWDRSGWLTAGLIFGGWLLMLVSTFVGCMALITFTRK